MKVLYIFMLLILLTSCESVNKKMNVKDDSVIEELVEEVIEKEVGIEIDLTPQSQEEVK